MSCGLDPKTPLAPLSPPSRSPFRSAFGGPSVGPNSPFSPFSQEAPWSGANSPLSRFPEGRKPPFPQNQPEQASQPIPIGYNLDLKADLADVGIIAAKVFMIYVVFKGTQFCIKRFFN